jgi:hypothetical protein
MSKTPEGRQGDQMSDSVLCGACAWHRYCTPIAFPLSMTVQAAGHPQWLGHFCPSASIQRRKSVMILRFCVS